MEEPVDIQSKFLNALKTQNAEVAPTGALMCPFGHHGRMFQSVEQLYDHAKVEHASMTELQGVAKKESRAKVKEMLKLRSDQTSNASAGDRSIPAIGGFAVDATKGPRQASQVHGKKRPSEYEFTGRKGKALTHVERADSGRSRHDPFNAGLDRAKSKSQDIRLFDYKQTTIETPSPYQTTPETSSESSADFKGSQFQSSQPRLPARPLPHRGVPKPQNPHLQPGLIELQRYDPRYPGLLLQPDSQPISQEQLASEVKSIYAGLTMVETKCIYVDRAQAAAAQENIDNRSASDHWQSLIAFHRAVLHKPHDFTAGTRPVEYSQHGTSHNGSRGPRLHYGTTGPSQVFEIPSVVATSNEINALGDFCAKKNFMKEAYAERLGLSIDRGDISTVRIGSGKCLTTIGSVVTPFRFKEESNVYSLAFHVLPDCIHNVILGKAFLKATNTFSSLANKARRVIRRAISDRTPRHFFYLGDNAPRFTGLLNGQRQEALADSGAKVLIMDEDYARSAGLPISTDGKHQTRLRFADGTTAMTSGMTHGVQWEFGLGAVGEEYTLDFHILKNAPAAVILSDEFLFGTNAFAEYDCYLIDEDDEDEDAHFFVIDRDRSYVNTVTATDGNKHRELIRHGAELDRIANLPHGERVAQRNLEDQRHAIETAKLNVTPSVGPAPASSPTAHAPKKRSIWRFKLFPKKQP